MDSRTQERVEQWGSRPFSGGYDGLADLATSGFSGAITTGSGWAFMLNGRIIGVIDGDIEDFETASGTCYDAPHPSLPLLCAMEAQGGETRGKYYTNETSLREVDSTLQKGSFTGYIELSENVLSGDYYAVYYGGRRMAAAYIGNANRLITGDEAFDRAADEVGIYEVITVDIEVTDVPETATSSSESASAGGATPSTAASDDTATATDSTGSATALGGGDDESDSVTTLGGGDEESDSVTALGAGDEELDSVTALGGGDDESDSVTALGTGDDNSDSVTALGAGDEESDSVTALGGGDDEESDPVTALGGGDDESDSVTALGGGDDESDSVTALGTGDDDSDSITALGAGDEESDSVTALGSGDDSGASIATPESETGEDDFGSGSPSGTDPEDESIDTPDDGAEPTPDPTQSSIETIADVVSSGEVAEFGEEPTDESVSTDEPDLTDESAGITTTGDVAPEPTSPGITDADPSQSPADSDSSQTRQAESSLQSSSKMDPAEVEAAVDALDQNEISWTEDEQTGTADDGGAIAGAGRDDSTAADETDRQHSGDTVRTIPSIDPEHSETPKEATETRSETRTRAETERPEATDAETTTGNSQPDRTQSRSAQAPQSQSPGVEIERVRAQARERIEAISDRLEAATEQRDTLREKAVALETERDQFRSKNQELVATIEQLQSRIDELEAELERARAAASEASADDTNGVDATTTLQPQQALSDTNLFVRYDSKSQPTLHTAHDGEADRSEVATNLQLEHHTGFDAADVAVDGMAYEEFLRSTMAYQFVEWVTEVLLYEIRDTDHADALVDLYDAIPRIDRVELNATISLADDDTEDVPDEVTFDVVAYDKMGNPLLVTNINNARSPATREMLEAMEASASAVKANYPSLAAATVVTSSYFEPGALEVVEAATSTGLLSRGSKMSFVNVSRKTGYHLCLVESRSGGFHMNVPEL